MSNPLGVFGALPVDLLSAVCRHLPMTDVVTVSRLDNRLEMLVERIIYREIKGLRVEINSEETTINFINKDKRVTQLNLNQFDWTDVVKHGKCIDTMELNIYVGEVSNQLFSVLKNTSFSLRTLKINVLDKVENSVQKLIKLHQKCTAFVSQHRSTLRHLEVTTADELHILMNVNTSTSTMRLTYNQAVEPKPSEQNKHYANNIFAYNMFHEYLAHQKISNVTLEIASKFDAKMALQKACQLAFPHSRRVHLERLTIEFGNSLKAVTEKDMKNVLIHHVDEFHLTTPNLQHFHCSLPHDEIDLSQEFLAMLNEPVRKSRKYPSSRPYNSSISLNAVRCK